MSLSGISSASQDYREDRVSQCPAQLRTAPKNSGDFSSSIFRGALPCLTRDSPSHSPGSSSLPKSSPNKSSSFFKNSGGYDLLLFLKLPMFHALASQVVLLSC